jgi:hypothetical protein
VLERQCSQKRKRLIVMTPIGLVWINIPRNFEIQIRHYIHGCISSDLFFGVKITYISGSINSVLNCELDLI